MLILSRKRFESVRINDDIEIKIIDVQGKIVRLGIDAPRNVIVHRQEIYDLIHSGEMIRQGEE